MSRAPKNMPKWIEPLFEFIAEEERVAVSTYQPVVFLIDRYWDAYVETLPPPKPRKKKPKTTTPRRPKNAPAARAAAVDDDGAEEEEEEEENAPELRGATPQPAARAPRPTARSPAGAAAAAVSEAAAEGGEDDDGPPAIDDQHWQRLNLQTEDAYGRFRREARKRRVEAAAMLVAPVDELYSIAKHAIQRRGGE